MSERGWFESVASYDRMVALEHKVQQIITVLHLETALADLQHIEDKVQQGIREIPINFAGTHPLPLPAKKPEKKPVRSHHAAHARDKKK